MVKKDEKIKLYELKFSKSNENEKNYEKGFDDGERFSEKNISEKLINVLGIEQGSSLKKIFQKIKRMVPNNPIINEEARSKENYIGVGKKSI